MGFESDDDEEEEPQPPAGGREAERARVHEAPDRPSSSLGIGIDDDDDAEPEIPSRGLREEEQAARRYEAPDPPSFSVCSDDDVEFLPGGHQVQAQVAPPASASTGIEEVEDDFFALGGGKPPSPRPGASRFRRLRKGPSLHRNQTRRYDFGIEDDDFLRGGQHHEQPRPQAVPHYVSVDEEDDDFFLAGEKLNPDPLPPSTRLKRLQRGPPSKEPKMSMTPEVIGKGALDVGSLEDEIEDFTDDDGPGRDVPPSVGSCASNLKFRHHALMNQSAVKEKVSKRKQQSTFSASKSVEESCTKKLLPKITISPMRIIHLIDSDTDVDDDWNHNQGKKSVSPLKNRNESMNKYIQEDPTLQQNSKPQGSIAAWKGKARMDDNWVTPASDEFCSEYFVPTFFNPNLLVKWKGILYQSSSSGAVRCDNPADNSPPAVHYFFHHAPMVRDLVRERLQYFFPVGTESTQGNEQNRVENLSYNQFGSSAVASNGWVTPSGRNSVRADVGRRVHGGETQSGSGHWYTGEDGIKESGRGFQEYRKEGAAKQGSSGSKRGTAKPKKEPAATK